VALLSDFNTPASFAWSSLDEGNHALRVIAADPARPRSPSR
jgi:hypothetical protein